MDKAMGDYFLSTDKAKLNLDVIHNFLYTCYWCKGIPVDSLERSVERSLCFGVYRAEPLSQVGFARVVTDYATFMHVADVFSVDEHRGQGLGIALIDYSVNHPDLHGIRTWTLLNAEAHGLYEKVSFEDSRSGRFMQRKIPYPYVLEEQS